MLRFPRSLPVHVTALVLALGSARAQIQAGVQETAPAAPVSTGGVEAGTPVKGEYLVHFDKQPYDLEVLRQAILGGVDAATYAKLFAGLEEQARAARRPVLKRVEDLGGTVVQDAWFAANVAWIRIDDERVGEVARIPGVAEVEQNLWYDMHIATSTNAYHHNSDAANGLKNAAGEYITGKGIGIAVLDTGCDANHASSGRPHAMYFFGGNPSNKSGKGIGGSRLRAAIGLWSSTDTEDSHSHGTMTQSCAASGGWNYSGADAGCAPEADVVSMKLVSGSSGGTTTAVLANGWNTCLSNRVVYNIKVANASFGGSPSFTSTDQTSLDNAAHFGDILITVSSGNSSTNLSGTAAVYNGLSVGACNKSTTIGVRNLASFSGRGTNPYGKVVPDIVAVGASVIMARVDNESSAYSASGTSFSSPLTAGAAAIVRHADVNLTALEARALMLANAEWGTEKLSGFGAGYLRADDAVKAALAQDVFTKKMTGSQTKLSYTFALGQGAKHAVAITFDRTSSSTPSENLDLYVYDPSGALVGSSTLSRNNSYDKVAFQAATAGTYRADVVGQLSSASATVDFAIAGAGQAVPPKLPNLTAISPAKVQVFDGGDVTLTGTDLAVVTHLLVNGNQVTPKSVSDKQIVFTPPIPTALGKVKVEAVNVTGKSNALDMEYVPVTTPKLVAQTLLFSLYSVTDAVWAYPSSPALLFFSPDAKPSKIPGLVDLGIGNNFASLYLFVPMVTNAVGEAKATWTVPTGLTNQTFHFQGVAIDGKTLSTPYPVTNLVSRTVLL
ncbi:MAG: S8 family serine peptidase [Planctomycetota bacterium]